jgi:hypothetical protein
VCGKREEGKSTLGLSLSLAFSPRVIIYDSRRQFEVGLPVSSLEELADALDNTSGIIVYQPGSDSDEEEMIEVAREVMARGSDHSPNQRFSFIIDEAGEVAKFGVGAKPLKKMIKWIRLDTVQVILLCHRPTDVDPTFRSLMTDFYLFRTTGDREIEWLRGVDSISDETIAAVQRLPRGSHYYLHISAGDDGYELNDKPDTWFVKYMEAGNAVQTV